MPRRSHGPRLYLDKRRNQWIIRDGTSFVRTGCARSDNEGAEKRLSEYIASKYRPAPTPAPLIADVLLFYAQEHLPTTAAANKAAHNISNLTKFWGLKKASDVTPTTCREYAKTRPPVGARRDLEVLRAALHFWDKNKTKLAERPNVALPDKPAPRERWLTREEARSLLRAAHAVPHLYRFVALGLATGSRSGVLLNLQWSWVDLGAGIMHRRAPGTAESATKKTPPVRLPEPIVRLMRLWKRKDGAIKYVVHYQGRKVTKLRRSMETACKAAGLEDVSAHTLRHTRATRLAQQGVPLWQIAGNLGMSMKTLESVYAKHSPHFQADAAKVLL